MKPINPTFPTPALRVRSGTGENVFKPLQSWTACLRQFLYNEPSPIEVNRDGWFRTRHAGFPLGREIYIDLFSVTHLVSVKTLLIVTSENDSELYWKKKKRKSMKWNDASSFIPYPFLITLYFLLRDLIQLYHESQRVSVQLLDEVGDAVDSSLLPWQWSDESLALMINMLIYWWLFFFFLFQSVLQALVNDLV